MTEQPTALRIRSRSVTKDSDAETNQVLAYGDMIEYAVTHECQYDGGDKLWIKFGTTSSVHADESTEQACKRVTDFVHGKAKELAKEAVDSVQSIDSL